METKKTKVSFIDAVGKKASIKLEITHRNGYPEFTASGEYDKSGGQCGDSIKPRTEKQKELLKLWDTYHLNGRNEELPDNLWQQVTNICETIEQEEEERTADSIKVIDPNNLDENDPRHELFEENAEDENCAALAFYLDLTVNEMAEITHEKYGYGNCLYNCQGIEYYCGTQEEINEAVQDYIENTAWAFNPSFLSDQTGIPQEAFKVMCGQCESSNDAILAIIEKTCGLESFVEAAINTDGWGHFLNRYDGAEDEIKYNNTQYLICRA